MKPTLSLAALACFATGLSTLHAADLKSLLDGGSLWGLNREAFAKQGAPFGFRWTSNQRDSSRTDESDLTFLGQKVYEVVTRFEGESLKGVTVLWYGRGDAGDLARPAYEELLRKSIAALDTYTGKKFSPRGKDGTSAVKADGVMWQTDNTSYTLEYSFTKENKAKHQDYRAEFIRLEMVKPVEKKGLVSASLPAAPTKSDPKSQVTRDTASGDVFVATVPMVDQGQKGYCAVACAERMLRYYGVDVDANEMAQIANTQTEGGTSSRQMFEALKKLTGRFRIRIQSIEDSDTAEYLKLISDYNRAAKRAKKPLLPEGEMILDMGAIYSAMDADLLKEIRTKNNAGTSRFLRKVQTHIDDGVPLCWSVQLGKFPEPGVPQSGGGHMRLIIGYNTKTNEIIFSDSWGAGHEKKRMPLDNAWTITTGLTMMEPIGR